MTVHCDQQRCYEPCAALPLPNATRESLINRLSAIAPTGAADGGRYRLAAGTTLFHGVSDGKFGWAELRDFSYVSNNLNPSIGAGIGEKSLKVRQGSGREEFVARLFELETKREVELILNNTGGHGKKINDIAELDSKHGGANDGYIGSEGEEELRLRGRMIDNYVLARSHFFPSPAIVEKDDGSDLTGSSNGEDVTYARWEPKDGYAVETLAFSDRLFSFSLLRQVHDAIDVTPTRRKYADALIIGVYHLVRRGTGAKTYVAFEEDAAPPSIVFFQAEKLKCHNHPNLTRRVAAFLVTSKDSNAVIGGGPLTTIGEERAFPELCKLWLERTLRQQVTSTPKEEPVKPIELSVPYSLVFQFVGKSMHTDERPRRKTYEVRIDELSAFQGALYPQHSAISNGSNGEDSFYAPLFAVLSDPNAPAPQVFDAKIRYNEREAPMRTLLGMYSNASWKTKWSTQSIIRHAILIRSRALLDHACSYHLESTITVAAMDHVLDAMSDLVLTAYYPDGTRTLGADAVWLASNIEPNKWFAENEGPYPKIAVVSTTNCGTRPLARMARTLTSLFSVPPRYGEVLVDLLTTPNNEINLAVAGELCACPDADWEAFRTGQLFWDRFKARATKWIVATKDWDVYSTRDRRIAWIKAVLKRQQQQPGGVPWSCRLDPNELVPKSAKDVQALGASDDVSLAEYEDLLRRSNLTLPDYFPDTDGISYEKLRIVVRHFRPWERGLPARVFITKPLLNVMVEFGGKPEEILLRNYDGFATDQRTPARVLTMYKESLNPPPSTWIGRTEAEATYGGKIGYTAELLLDIASSKRGDMFLKEMVAFLSKLNAVSKIS